jgi:hypothetical protein
VGDRISDGVLIAENLTLAMKFSNRFVLWPSPERVHAMNSGPSIFANAPEDDKVTPSRTFQSARLPVVFRVG